MIANKSQIVTRKANAIDNNKNQSSNVQSNPLKYMIITDMNIKHHLKKLANTLNTQIKPPVKAII